MTLEGLSDLDGKPRPGMEFESKELAYDFYNKYALKTRFNIIKETFSKNK